MKENLKIKTTESAGFGITDPLTKLILINDVNYISGNNPTTKLHISNDGCVEILPPLTYIEISIDRFNELNSNSKWEMISHYLKNDMMTTLWRNKETKQLKEGIGNYPPSEKLNI